MSEEELSAEYEALKAQYQSLLTENLSIDMSRGKPGAEQLNLTEGMLTVVSTNEQCHSENGQDCRNYGDLLGLHEARALFSELLDIPYENIVLGGNSSLNMMYDALARAMLYGVPGGDTPWCRLPKVKFLCPAPGYDRHFAICESLGIEMIPVTMTETGPDMTQIEYLVSKDESIKGIWCVPKYSNPDGITYSDDTVRRFANLSPKAKDFRIFWDNAYGVHDIAEEGDTLLNLFRLMQGTEKENMLYLFFSTSKITYAGGGVALMAASDENVEHMKKIIGIQTIGPDKVNQLRHVRYFGDADGIRAHMRRHADILRPKFEAVLHALRTELEPAGIARWNTPKGGYFVSVFLAPGTAKRTWQLMKKLGITLTGVGATYPYGKDPEDSNLRIAPSCPTPSELERAMECLCVTAKLAYLEHRLNKTVD